MLTRLGIIFKYEDPDSKIEWWEQLNSARKKVHTLNLKTGEFELMPHKGCDIIPVKRHLYTPDFIFKDCPMIIETKGRLLKENIKMHKLINEQHPHLDIRFVFNNPNARTGLVRTPTYASWCKKHGFRYAKKEIPRTWITEIRKHQQKR